MVEITNWKVYDLEESINACRYSMFSKIPEEIDFNASLERAKKLALCPTHSGECNFLKGIRVSFDIKYPQYLSPELQRYNWLDIVTSQSKMHKLTKMDLVECCNQYVTKATIDNLNQYIQDYNYIIENSKATWQIYKAWMKVISNCPLGLELTMRCSTNYLQLRTVYNQRKNHKLKEDWGAFCDWITKLPYADKFITVKNVNN